MQGAFEWISKIAEYIGKFIPSFELIHYTHRGLKFIRGKSPKKLKPGLYLYWPLTTSMWIIPVVRQGLLISPVPLLTKDKKSVLVGGLVVFCVKDIFKVGARTWDMEETIAEVSHGIIPRIIFRRTLDELVDLISTEDKSRLDEEFTANASRILRGFGIKVIYCAFTHFSMCTVLSVSGGNAAPNVVIQNGDDE